MIYLDDPDFTLYNGDACEVLSELPAESVQMCVTSPPFFGLRDYGTGSWKGGDAECDHRKPTPSKQSDPTIRKSTLQSNKKSPGLSAGTLAMKTAQAEGSYGYRDVCGKCGATRVDRQIGLEPTPEEWVAQLVAVFEQVRRVLRKDGTLWVEVGDSFSGGGRGAGGEKQQTNSGSDRPPQKPPPGYKQKDLIGQPFLLAFALREAGWYWRNVCIWHKPNPMPESVRDRFTVSHSYVLLFSKSSRYFFDAEAVREEFEARPQQRLTSLQNQPGAKGREAAGVAQGNPQGGAHASRFNIQSETLEVENGLGQHHGDGDGGVRRSSTPDGDIERSLRTLDELHGQRGTAAELAGRDRGHPAFGQLGRNARSVWTIATEPLPFEHYAAFPQALAERCIKAGTSERGCCPECGAPWVRQVERELVGGHPVPNARAFVRDASGPAVGGSYAGGSHVGGRYDVTTTGWRPSCECVGLDDVFHPPIPCTVLDPFIGSGTTALVARRLGRRCIGVELSPTYCALTARRTQQLSLLDVDAGIPEQPTAQAASGGLHDG